MEMAYYFSSEGVIKGKDAHQIFYGIGICQYTNILSKLSFFFFVRPMYFFVFCMMMSLKVTRTRNVYNRSKKKYSTSYEINFSLTALLRRKI